MRVYTTTTGKVHVANAFVESLSECGRDMAKATAREVTTQQAWAEVSCATCFDHFRYAESLAGRATAELFQTSKFAR